MVKKLVNKKTLIIVGAVLLSLIATVLILLFTVFSLNENGLQVSFKNQSEFQQTENFENVLFEKSGIKKNASVFFINKTKAKQNLEKEFPLLKIVNIETIFPNKLTFHVAERESVFAVKNTSLNFFTILDEDFKVLSVLNQTQFLALETKPIVAVFENSALINLEEGDFVEKNETINLLTNLSKNLLINNRDAVEQKALFKKVEVYDNLLCLYLQDDFLIKIHTPKVKLQEKIDLALRSLSVVYPSYYQTHFMEVYLTQSEKLLVKFTNKTV
ncbi:MAG: cell division protein FtsQ/DivIB [Christensenellales bacterium]|jgi:cell division septal protein FtsQ